MSRAASYQEVDIVQPTIQDSPNADIDDQSDAATSVTSEEDMESANKTISEQSEDNLNQTT